MSEWESNRRIGRRLEIDPYEIVWATDAGTGGAFRRRRTKEYPGRIVDVSVSGAAVEGPAKPLFPPGSEALLRFEDGMAAVKVVRSEPTTDPTIRVYGIDFLLMDARVTARVHALVGEGRPFARSWLER
jgi:hypothetical protein